jgi:hypothetical protein
MSRRKISLPLKLAMLIAAASPISAHALLGIDSPWCMGDGGGTFLCVRGADRVKLAKESADLDYLPFVQKAFAAPTITYVPDEKKPAVAETWHRDGGGLNLYRHTLNNDRRKMMEAAVDWFKIFCKAKGGGTYEYPINETTELVNLTRLACHARPTTPEQVMGQMPMFGIEISPADNYSTDRPKDPFVAFKHFGNGSLVKAAWGYPKRYAFGDQTNLGMVVEVKVPMAKVQTEVDGKPYEKWVKLIDLVPIPRQQNQ